MEQCGLKEGGNTSHAYHPKPCHNRLPSLPFRLNQIKAKYDEYMVPWYCFILSSIPSWIYSLLLFVFLPLLFFFPFPPSFSSPTTPSFSPEEEISLSLLSSPSVAAS
mmetsp:Transcript_7838/g.11865  ORF Transcript_7838/g.11865 Transcript_7838/m.11865 type:complete len:107 (-) Transcript_7838:81-401(-)